MKSIKTIACWSFWWIGYGLC